MKSRYACMHALHKNQKVKFKEEGLNLSKNKGTGNEKIMWSMYPT